MILTNEEIEKVLGLYIGCNVYSYSIDTIVRLGAIDKIAVSLFEAEVLKLSLTPLSKITDEHAEIIGEILGYKITSTRLDFTTAIYQQLILWQYAVPLYFGINHPCNGLNAIELNLAIEKL